MDLHIRYILLFIRFTFDIITIYEYIVHTVRFKKTMRLKKG